MSLLNVFKTPEFQFGDFLFPWGLIVGAIAFVLAWMIVVALEQKCWTRHIWHLPLFFVSLWVLLGCTLGLILAP